MLLDEKMPLLELLKKLNIKINDYFDPSNPLGYHNTNIDVSLIKDLFINKISSNEMILSKNEVSLGKRGKYKDGNNMIIIHYSLDDWCRIKESYEDIKHIKSVPKMEFPKEKIIKQEYIAGTTLFLSKETSTTHKYQLINFIKQMNQAGYAHRDLHCKNIIINKDHLYVIDWDFVIKQKCNLLESYDLTANGLESPHLTHRTHIFKSWMNLNIPSVSEILGITLNDFI